MNSAKLKDRKITQKSVEFPHTNNEQFKKELRKQFHLHERIKHLGINFTKEVKDLTLKTTRHCWKKLTRHK